MKNENKVLLATVAVAFGLSSVAGAANPPRGHEVRPLAGNCGVGAFPQTTKAGEYNVLCDSMQDSEKCLALIKQHFSVSGTTVTVDKVNSYQADKAAYCLDVLKRDLGL